MKSVHVCFLPEYLEKAVPKNSDLSIVVVDILRATSCFVAGIHSGIKSIMPVLTVEEAREKKLKDHFLAAGERNGERIDGFDMGNSPFDYIKAANVKNINVVATTTNGTRALNAAQNFTNDIFIAAFSNLNSTASYLSSQDNLLILCSGWKGKPCLEDILFAGALTNSLIKKYSFNSGNDEAMMSLSIWNDKGADLPDVIAKTEHALRLKSKGIQKDLDFCSIIDNCPTVLKYTDGTGIIKVS